VGRPEQLSVSWSFVSSRSDGSIDPQNGNNKGRPSVALCRAADTKGMMKHHHHHHMKKM
jgi:hypothetical protein